MVITVVGACVQAVVFGQFAHLIASLDGQSSQFKRQITTIVDSMMYHDFPESLKVPVHHIAASCIPQRSPLNTVRCMTVRNEYWSTTITSGRSIDCWSARTPWDS